MKIDSYVYGLICPIDNIIRYIGKTDGILRKRLNRHINDYKRTKQKNKVKTHKERWLEVVDNSGMIYEIKIIEIEKCDIDLVFEREIYWISYYNNVLFKKLTNTTDGGEGLTYSDKHLQHLKECLSKYRGKNNPISKPIACYNLISKEVLNFDSGGLCKEYFKIPKSVFYNLIKTGKSYNSWVFSYNDVTAILKSIDSILPYYHRIQDTKVSCLNLITNIIVEYDSIIKCAKSINRSEPVVHKYIKRKLIYDDKIFYIGTTPNIEEYKQVKNNLGIIKFQNKTIEVIDLIENHTSTYDSVAEIKVQIGISYTRFQEICNTDKLYKGRYSIKKIPKPMDYCGSSSISGSSCHLVPAMS